MASKTISSTRGLLLSNFVRGTRRGSNYYQLYTRWLNCWENKSMQDRYKTRLSFASAFFFLPAYLFSVYTTPTTFTSLLANKLFTRQIVYISNIPCRHPPHNHILPTRIRPTTSVASVASIRTSTLNEHCCPCRCTNATSAVLVVSGWYRDVIRSQSATSDGTTELDTDTALEPLCKTTLPCSGRCCCRQRSATAAEEG